MEFFSAVLRVSIIEMCYLTGLLILTGLVLGVFERLSVNFIQKSFGYKGILITAWLGTPIHELGHALMCIIFNHKIKRIKLLNIKSENGVLGYVEHSYNPANIYQSIGNLFIGLGPIFSGIASLTISMYILLPSSFAVFKSYVLTGIKSNKLDINLAISLLNSCSHLLKSIFTTSNLISLKFWIFIIAAVCISSHIALSKQDIKGAKNGFIVLFITILSANFVLRFFSINTAHFIIQLARYNAHIMGLLMVALLFSAFTLLMSFLCSIVFFRS